MAKLMSSADITNLQNKMLIHFNLPVVTFGSDGVRHRPIHSRKAIMALDVSDQFIHLIQLHPVDGQPTTIEQMTEEIRYNMGLGMIAWFFARIFISQLIIWLWNNYSSSVTVTTSGST